MTGIDGTDENGPHIDGDRETNERRAPVSESKQRKSTRTEEKQMAHSQGHNRGTPLGVRQQMQDTDN